MVYNHLIIKHSWWWSHSKLLLSACVTQGVLMGGVHSIGTTCSLTLDVFIYRWLVVGLVLLQINGLLHVLSIVPIFF